MDEFVIWQRAEGALVFAASLAAVVFLEPGFGWWLAILLFFAPDVSFAAYLLGPRLGAIGYNLLHVFGFGSAVFCAGLLGGSATIMALGLLWLGHAGFDRMVGYGLKSSAGFCTTHLGTIGGTERR
ncbi:DUF4260 domain-containing protein [Roseitranquillus sediminis]|uniref:DUF4260 domain-containing protein n=1 Tax=Roseitranquillus sediminis TaxID=2809051 RepID=UPI001D0C1762|nr:DUF4260 domain-containing protein [Roseitranquillus sediminis]MBM9594847.1 DUF4260 domain-containing protein [Roseitranquillus sediminis]